jgi:hypothetical protein
VVAALSSAAVAVRAAGRPEAVPSALFALLIQFVEPGAAVWWFTLGGPFRAFPSDPEGYAVVVAGNTVCWMLAALVLVFVVRGALRVLAPRQG